MTLDAHMHPKVHPAMDVSLQYVPYARLLREHGDPIVLSGGARTPPLLKGDATLLIDQLLAAFNRRHTQQLMLREF